MDRIAPRREGINWPVASFLVGYHLVLAIGLPLYLWHRSPAPGLIACSVALLLLTEIGIGAAYHRYYSHRCYRLATPAESFLLFLATLATQGSALQWSYEHRLHHAHVDTDDDPYSIRKGFWYAHVLWLFEPSRPVERGVVSDLLENRLVRFQDRFIGPLMILANLGVVVALGLAFGDWWGALLIGWVARMALGHHLTWFVNSLAHCWGERTYSREHSAVDNYILAFLTVGEGYHNYHHTFASDYRNGVRWYHFDPVKWTVWSLSKIGLARDLKRYDRFKIRKRLLSEDRKLLLARLGEMAHAKKAELEQAIEAQSRAIQARLNRLSTLTERVRELRRRGSERTALLDARQEMRQLREKLERDFAAWYRLCATVL